MVGIIRKLMSKKNKIEKVYSDISWGVPVFNRNVHKFFKF